jgi:glycine/D-amino acid oxidase-like deaminating enzyme
MSSIHRLALSSELERELVAYRETVLSPECDLLVVGAGLVGLATAWFAAERGMTVQVVDAGDLAGGASGASFGGVWPNELGATLPDSFQELALASRDLWGRLSVRPGMDFDWRVNGFVQVEHTRFAPSADAFVDLQLERGWSLTAVDAEQLAKLVPGISPARTEGVLYPSEAQLDPVKTALSLARGITRAGGRIRTGLRVESARYSAKTLSEATLETGSVRPAHVVIATGWRLDWLGDSAPKLPLRALGGQAVASNPVAPLLKPSLSGGVMVTQTRAGHVLVGASLVEGPLESPDSETTSRLIAAARELFPPLNNVEFPHAWVGNRPATPDGLPVIDRLPGIDNAWLACGHHRAGVLLASGTGQQVAEWVATGKTSLDLTPYRADRFG